MSKSVFDFPNILDPLEDIIKVGKLGYDVYKNYRKGQDQARRTKKETDEKYDRPRQGAKRKLDYGEKKKETKKVKREPQERSIVRKRMPKRTYRNVHSGGVVATKRMRRKRRFRRKCGYRRTYVPYALKKYVNRRLKSPDAINIYRSIDSGVVVSSPNSQSWTTFSLMARAQLHTALAASEHYEDNGAGAVTTVATNIGDNASLHFKVRVVSAYVTYHFRNNSTLPCDMYTYKMFCKSNTSLLPTNMLSLAIAEKGIAAAITSPLVSLYDGNCTAGWRRDWKITQYNRYRLNPGDECSVTLKRKRPFFHEANQEDDDEEYLRGVTQLLVVNLQGCIYHSDADDSKVGTDEAQLDYIMQSGIKFGCLPATHYTRVIDTGAYDEFADGVAIVPDNEHQGMET